MGIVFDAYALQLILIAFCGSLLGEAVREVNNETPVAFCHFVAEFAAGGFMALMVAIMIKLLVIKDEPLLVMPITGFLAFAGRKRSSALIERLLSTVLSRGGVADDAKKKDVG